MSKPVDYSKWDHIELSDDEDDVHPNIDKESWFRMKHRSRVEREEAEEKDKKRILEEVRYSFNFRKRIFYFPYSSAHIFVDVQSQSAYSTVGA